MVLQAPITRYILGLWPDVSAGFYLRPVPGFVLMGAKRIALALPAPKINICSRLGVVSGTSARSSYVRPTKVPDGCREAVWIIELVTISGLRTYIH
jgi:hypothetical protein